MFRRSLKFIRRTGSLAFGKLPPPKRDPHLVIQREMKDQFLSWGFYDKRHDSCPKVLVASGFGYGNVGDEAQLGACISRWQKVSPEASITLLSPNPAYSSALHGKRVEWSPRVAWFRSNTIGPYFDDKRFPRYFKWLHFRTEISARCFRAGLPLLFCTPRETRIMQLVQEHDVIHISGGGFLTGKTRSRLWEFCLLMRVCQLLGKPYLLTGHNIGVFQDKDDKRIAAMGLKGAFHIGLRDKGISEKEIASIGIKGSHVVSSCDDALFCERLESAETRKRLEEQGVDAAKPWVAVNFHHWGQAPEERDAIESRFAAICDGIRHTHGMQIVFIAMTPSDVDPERRVSAKMREANCCFPYSPDYRVVRGIIADAAFVFTMKHHPIVFAQGEGVPIVSVALDAYYHHKNKGAMDNTGDGEYLAGRDTFNSSDILNLIGKVIQNNDSIRSRIRLWSDAMRKIELNPYREALAHIDQPQAAVDLESEGQD